MTIAIILSFDLYTIEKHLHLTLPSIRRKMGKKKTSNKTDKDSVRRGNYRSRSAMNEDSSSNSDSDASSRMSQDSSKAQGSDSSITSFEDDITVDMIISTFISEVKVSGLTLQQFMRNFVRGVSSGRSNTKRYSVERRSSRKESNDFGQEVWPPSTEVKPIQLLKNVIISSHYMC
jgi:hypothetical protein